MYNLYHFIIPDLKNTDLLPMLIFELIIPYRNTIGIVFKIFLFFINPLYNITMTLEHLSKKQQVLLQKSVSKTIQMYTGVLPIYGKNISIHGLFELHVHKVNLLI